MSTPAIVVEDGTGKADANSYVDLAFAQSYHEAALYVTVWDAANPEDKSKALLMAARMIDGGMKFKGWKANPTQAMEWPRIYAENSEGPGVAYWLGYGPTFGTWYGCTEVPDRLKKAQAELAHELLKKNRAAEWNAIGVSSVGLGSGALAIDFEPNAESKVEPFTPAVLDFLAPLGWPRSSGVSADVRRG